MNKSTSNATKASQSAMWVYGQKFFLMVFGLFATAILARKLSPAEYGLVALSNAILYFGLFSGKPSVGSFVIYDQKDGREQRAQAAFWINMLMVLFSLFLFVIAMPIIQIYYKEPLLPLIMGANVLRFAIEQLGIVPDALIRRKIDYYKLVIRDSILQLIATALSIWMALTGWGVWSLILPYLLIAPIQVIAVMWMANWKPTFSLNLKYWKDILAYIGPLIATSFLGIVNTNSDNFLVGTLIGPAGLGIYDRAWRTSNLATDNIVAVVADVSMPFLSSLKAQTEKLRESYMRMLLLLGITTMPLHVGLFVLAEEFIFTLYGPSWGAAVLPLRLLLIFTLRRAISSPASVVYNVVGKPKLGFKLSLIGTPIIVLAVIIGSNFGLVGVAFAMMLARTIWGFVGMYYASGLINVTLAEILREEWQPFQASLIMALIISAAKYLLLLLSVPSPLILLFCSMLGALAYFILLATRYQNLLNELLLLLDRLFPPVSRFIRVRILRKE